MLVLYRQSSTINIFNRSGYFMHITDLQEEKSTTIHFLYFPIMSHFPFW